MATFEESDLFKKDYEFTTTKQDDPTYTGKLDRDKVNKKEAYEVKDFCNAYLKNNNIAATKENFQKVEKLIRLPQVSNIVMRSELNSFVTQNWNKGWV